MRFMLKSLLVSVLLLAAAVPSAAAEGSSAAAIIRLLNSRASGSPKGYADAAEEIAPDAAAGRPLQGFVLALVSTDPAAPAAARLDDATREKYLNAARGRIRALAEKKNNPLAWYLLSLDTGDTNLLRRAADGHNVQAMNAWGSLVVTRTLEGPRTTNALVVLDRAFDLFKRAAGEGDANGLYNLGMCYAQGLGTARDDEAALNCFRAAAEKGHPEAINNIGSFCREGRVITKDPVAAAKWFAKSASYGNAFGQLNYGFALQHGEGVPKDEEKAVKLFKAAADQANPEAMNAYATALWKGHGAEVDYATAFRYFAAAAEFGYPPAMDNLSACYERGTGVKASDKLATQWKIRARAARGDRAARIWLIQNGLHL